MRSANDFGLAEVGKKLLDRLWLRGGFPRSYLAPAQADSNEWRRQFIRAFLERDLPQMGVTIPAATMLRFWTMLAHYHGQVWNAAEPARSLGVSEPTTRRYLDLLCGFFMARQLPPWHENLAKRQIKAPKIYVRDTGLLHTACWASPTNATSWAIRSTAHRGRASPSSRSSNPSARRKPISGWLATIILAGVLPHGGMLPAQGRRCRVA